MKIGWASMDWSRIEGPDGHPTPGGSGWYRCHLPHQALVSAGVDSVIGRLVFSRTERRLGVRKWGSPDDGTEDHYDVDLIVLQRWMLSGLADDIKVARSTGQIIVQDVDDWFFGIASQNIASRAFDTPVANLQHYRKILGASNLITVSTPYLASRLSRFHPHVAVVRNHIDADRWPMRTQHDQPVLGWAGAVPWRSGDLETLRGILPQVTAKHRTPFHHSGHIGGDWPTAYEALGLDALDPAHTATPMAPITEWPDQFTFDVGIVPLSDRPFNLAKSYIKGLEYAAAGIPFVAQGTPEYRDLANRLGVGRSAVKPREWIRQLDLLLSMSAKERSDEAARNRQALRDQHLTVDHLAEHWLAAVTLGLPSSLPPSSSPPSSPTPTASV